MLAFIINLLVQADLVETLSASGTFTVFAPTNQAFETLAASMGVTVTQLLELPNLVDILEYHVAPRQYLAEDLYDGEQITTVEGKAIEVLFKGQRVFVDTVAVAQTDLIASNGVVHIISGVLIPPTEIPPMKVSASPRITQTIVQVALNNQLTDLLSALVVVSADGGIFSIGTVISHTTFEHDALPSGRTASVQKSYFSPPPLPHCVLVCVCQSSPA